MRSQGQDRRIFRKLIKYLGKKKTSRKILGQLMLGIGRLFLGKPYLAGTLETKKAEHLIVNLREFDCVTFVESLVTLVWCLRSREKSFEAFRRLLRRIRYRQGRLQGYPSRLHYFSDWIHDNQKKGFLKDVTRKIGGRLVRKAIDFMTAHPDLYPQLENMVNLRKMRVIERRISRRSFFFIPKKDLRRLEDRIGDGDIIGITTNTEGLDVQHVGLAVRVKDRIHLLHASSFEGRVVLSEETLYRYLMKSKARSGIMVARIV